MKKERQRGGLRAEREVGTRGGGGGGGNGTKGDGNQEGAEKNKRGSEVEDGSRMEGKNRGKRTCAVNVESWQSG